MSYFVENVMQWLAAWWNSVDEYYMQVRVPLFSAFITLASLLLAMQNFLVINLYRDVYSKPDYQTFVKSRGRPKRIYKYHWLLRQLSHRFRAAYTDDQSIFGPLERLSSFLRDSTAIMLAVSVLQLLVGGIKDSPLAAFICLVATVIGIVRMYRVIRVQRAATAAWMDWLRSTETKQS